MPRKKLLLPALAALFIGVYFITLTKDTLRCYFSPDDLMTIYRSWANPLGALVKANLVFFVNSPFYRPMGSVFYRGMYDIAGGLNPLPFHIANLCLLSANIWFTYCIARRLTRSRTAGAIAALLIAYHGRFISLYFDTGYIYDVLVYFFYFAAFLFYLRVRSHELPPKAWELITFSALFICALNAKEMAVTLPVTLVLYEWFYHRPTLRRVSDFWRWLTQGGSGVVIAGFLTLLFVIGRTRGDGLMSASTAFRPVFTLHQFMETSVNFVTPLFFKSELLPAWVVLAIWAAMFAIAWVMKSRALKFAWWFLILSTLPVAFIQPRGPGQYYVTFFGWVLYAATLLDDVTSRLLARTATLARLRPAGVILCTGIAMYAVNSHYRWTEVTAVSEEGEELRDVVKQIQRLRPVLRHGARILFLNDPILDPWRMHFVMRLGYRDDSLEIDRAKFMQPPPTASQIASYDYVFDFHHGRFYPSPTPRQGPKPEVVIEWGHPAVFHSDWRRVTPEQPAQRGESLISMVSDLGATEPPVPLDKPFPSDPFAKVTSPVEVLVDGKPAEIQLKMGWPDLVNKYRLDFQIPQNVRAGELEISVRAGDKMGMPTPIPVR